MDEENHPVESSGPNRRILIIALSGVVIIGTCALFGLAFLWFQPGQNSLFANIFPSPTATIRPTRALAADQPSPLELTATQQAWIKPDQSPALIAYDSIGSFLHLGDIADTRPNVPDIHQPGDVYVYGIKLDGSDSLLWGYTWCTTTQEILNENFAHIQLEFTINETPVDDFTVRDSQDSGSACREHVALLYRWPNGQHQLESRITFTQDMDDGWNVYPAGTHIFKYIVTVNEGFTSSSPQEKIPTIQTAVSNTTSNWNTLLSDTFDNNANQWHEGTYAGADGTITYEVTDGKYLWSATAQNELINRILLGEKASDFYFTTDIQNSRASGNVGVTFREDDNGNFYYFGITTLSNRQCSLLQFYGDEVTELINWDYCPAIISNGPNKITIFAEGDHIIVLINDQFVGDAYTDLITGDKIGLAIRNYDNGTTTYEFDNLELRAP